MKILLFVDKLYGGGAERVASILLNHLCEKHNVTAVIFDDKLPTYPINPLIKIQKITVNGKIGVLHPIERIAKIRKAIKGNSPDLVISFLVEINRYSIIANLHTGYKIILSEHTSIQGKQKIWLYLTRHILYRFATKVTLLSGSDYKYARWMRNKTLMYNPLSYSIFKEQSQREKTIVAVSSQKRWHVKGFDLLIQAWAKIAPSNPDWRLQFIGANNSNYISEMAKSSGIENRVDFSGWTNEIDQILRTKSIYVLSSRREGFPCSLLEAMSQGCACVAFDCKTGPNEIITDGKSGLLAHNGDINDLAAKLQRLIDDEQLRQRLAKGATEEARRFEKGKIMRQWDDLIDEVTLNTRKKANT